MKDNLITLPLPAAIKDLWDAQQALVIHYSHTGLKFTLDGRLVGDIAEALALHHFDLLVPKSRIKGVDALTKSGKTVQVKATGNPNSGPAFTPGQGRADHLLFFGIFFRAGIATVLYNGPESPVRELLPAKSWSGTKVLSLSEVRRLSSTIPMCDRIPLVEDLAPLPLGSISLT
ncbi:hypothetical protein GTP81_09725 [Rugamonas sp. FT107W]|uniref:DUF6998 domain-containing protein n=1 Tax=Duganella vulcania TaxID=2692166 RepID=A0A845HE43_9BURK|nr:hypothetical protein [Duganella vulcania]MYN17031.1 hypothetical protein [Duganella vulcania]